MSARPVVVLPPELASQIAAGEVVERPASVVKELVENSIDAEATRCDVAIVGGGITSISVSDDGHGMSERDARLAVERHATSKLTQFSDLDALTTFGFRGEALPSIASVSRLRIETRARNADAGVEVVVEGVAPPVTRPIGRPPGTRIEVKDLFFNVPARRKFLKSSGTESGHVTDVVEAAALSRPGVTFTLTRDGRKVREYLRAQNRFERVRQVVEDVELAPCVGERGPLSVEAYLSRPEAARSGGGALYLLVNDRVVKDRQLLVTVAQAYGNVLERGRYPRGVIYLDLPPELVDVNVHPQKTEVRFADARALNDAVYSVLSRALSSAFSLPPTSRAAWGKPATTAALKVPSRAAPHIVHEALNRPSAPAPLDARRLAPPLRADAESPSSTSTQRAEARAPSPSAPLLGQARPGAPASTPSRAAVPPADPARPLGAPADPARPLGAPGELARPVELPLPSVSAEGTSPASAVPDGSAPGPSDAERARALRAERDSAATAPLPSQSDVRWSNLRFVAQLKKTYLLCEGHDGYYLLDQHAAAERVNFSRLRRQYQSQSVVSQALLFPVTLEVTRAEAELVEHYASEIQAMGLDVRLRGPESLSVHGVPRLLQRAGAERLVRDLLAELSRQGGREFSAAVDLTLATMACHGSIRAGDPLTPEEVQALLHALDEADFAGHCPHGRPVVTFTSWSELERKVGRR